MQSKAESFIEASLNILFGAGVALGSQLIIFPQFDIHIPIGDHLMITLYFTVISLARSYLIRRYYNFKLMKRYSHV